MLNKSDYGDPCNAFEIEPLISVIIPSYNVENYISDCLASLEMQTMYNHIEVILIDDGSSDNTIKVLKKYVERNKNFYLYIQKNKGAGIARNLGLSKAKGEFVTFLDSDDKLITTACELLYKKAISEDSDIVIGQTAWARNENELEPVQYMSSWFNGDLEENFRANDDIAEGIPVIHAKLIRRNILINNSVYFPDIRYGQDTFFSVQCWYYSKNIHIIADIVYIRAERTEKNNKSLTQTFTADVIKHRLEAMRLVDKFYEEKKLTKRLYPIGHIVQIYLKLDNRESKKRALRYILEYIKSSKSKTLIRLLIYKLWTKLIT